MQLFFLLQTSYIPHVCLPAVEKCYRGGLCGSKIFAENFTEHYFCLLVILLNFYFYGVRRFFFLFIDHFCVNLGGFYIGMPQHFADGDCRVAKGKIRYCMALLFAFNFRKPFAASMAFSRANWRLAISRKA
jgi:hypothetical protein